MQQSTKYLLTLLHLQKLSRVKAGPKYMDTPWASFRSLRAAAEERYGAFPMSKEKVELLAVRELVVFYIPFWENSPNPEY